MVAIPRVHVYYLLLVEARSDWLLKGAFKRCLTRNARPTLSRLKAFCGGVISGVSGIVTTGASASKSSESPTVDCGSRDSCGCAFGVASGLGQCVICRWAGVPLPIIFPWPPYLSLGLSLWIHLSREGFRTKNTAMTSAWILRLNRPPPK